MKVVCTYSDGSETVRVNVAKIKILTDSGELIAKIGPGINQLFSVPSVPGPIRAMYEEGMDQEMGLKSLGDK